MYIDSHESSRTLEQRACHTPNTNRRHSSRTCRTKCTHWRCKRIGRKEHYRWREVQNNGNKNNPNGINDNQPTRISKRKGTTDNKSQHQGTKWDTRPIASKNSGSKAGCTNRCIQPHHWRKIQRSGKKIPRLCGGSYQRTTADNATTEINERIGHTSR